MVYIGVLGAENVGKTSILWLFKKYIDEGLIKRVDKNIVVKRLEEDFRGESKVTEGGVNLTITITPNRLVFNESKTGSNHTLFAPGGHKNRNVVKMGIITVSKLVRSVVAIFALDRPLKEQFEFYKDIRFFPKLINVCFNKVDLIANDSMEQKLKNYEGEIIEFFGSKKIAVKKFYRTCAAGIPDMEKYNDEVVKMLLDIATTEK